MKILGTCFPNDIWFKTPSLWYGRGLWAARDMHQMLKMDQDLMIETRLSESNFTHPLLQTVMDARVDVAPIEVGMTSQRHEFLDFTNPVVYAKIHIISKRIQPNDIGDFLLGIFDQPTMICIGLSFVVMSSIIWFSNWLQNRDAKHGLAYIFIHTIGAALNQGYPLKMRLGSQATNLAALFGFMAMIVSTIFSGLVISQLMKKPLPLQIRNLENLKANPDLKIIISPKSYIDDIFESTSNLQVFKPRIEWLQFDISNVSSLQNVKNKIMEGTHVWVDDSDNFKKYIKILETANHTPQLTSLFYLSEPILHHPGAWIMPKNLNPKLKEQINLGLQWLIDLGHYKYYTEAINSQLFRHLGSYKIDAKNAVIDVSGHNGQISAICKGRPKDRRDILAYLLRPDKPADFAELIGQPKMSMVHLKPIFFTLIGGYIASTIVFCIELVLPFLKYA